MENEKEFISLSEAAKLANVSSMTIRRFAKKLQASDNPDDTCSVKVLSDKNPFGKKYQIAKDKVMSGFSVTGVTPHVNDTVITNGNEDAQELDFIDAAMKFESSVEDKRQSLTENFYKNLGK